jgi:hypothetical protein
VVIFFVGSAEEFHELGFVADEALVLLRQSLACSSSVTIQTKIMFRSVMPVS